MYTAENLDNFFDSMLHDDSRAASTLAKQSAQKFENYIRTNDYSKPQAKPMNSQQVDRLAQSASMQDEFPQHDYDIQKLQRSLQVEHELMSEAATGKYGHVAANAAATSLQDAGDTARWVRSQ